MNYPINNRHIEHDLSTRTFNSELKQYLILNNSPKSALNLLVQRRYKADLTSIFHFETAPTNNGLFQTTMTVKGGTGKKWIGSGTSRKLSELDVTSNFIAWVNQSNEQKEDLMIPNDLQKGSSSQDFWPSIVKPIENKEIGQENFKKISPPQNSYLSIAKPAENKEIKPKNYESDEESDEEEGDPPVNNVSPRFPFDEWSKVISHKGIHIFFCHRAHEVRDFVRHKMSKKDMLYETYSNGMELETIHWECKLYNKRAFFVFKQGTPSAKLIKKATSFNGVFTPIWN